MLFDNISGSSGLAKTILQGTSEKGRQKVGCIVVLRPR